MKRGTIRVGIGGWTYEPWRGTFFPQGLPHKRELSYAAETLTAIEINGTYYGSQKPESFARWRDETPENFVFSVKGPRFTTNRRVLGEAAASIERFVTGGVTRLGPKLGPINWQFLPGKAFDPPDFEAFLKLLPASHDGVALRHVVEVRHDSFRVPEFLHLLRQYAVAPVFTDKDEFPQIPDVAASFVYIRLQRASEAEEAGYPAGALDDWAKRVTRYAEGKGPDPAAALCPNEPMPREARDVFLFMINGFKTKAPAAAAALIERVGRP